MSVTMGSLVHDGNLAVQQMYLPFLMHPRNTESVERQICFSLQWSKAVVFLPTSLCNNMGGDGGSGGGGGGGSNSSSSSSSSRNGDDSSNNSLQFLCPYAD